MIDATVSVFTRVFRCIHPLHIVSNQMLTMVDWDFCNTSVYSLLVGSSAELRVSLKMKICGLVKEPITEVHSSPSGHSWPFDPGHDPLGQRLPLGVKKDHWQASPRVVTMETTGDEYREVEERSWCLQGPLCFMVQWFCWIMIPLLDKNSGVAVENWIRRSFVAVLAAIGK